MASDTFNVLLNLERLLTGRPKLCKMSLPQSSVGTNSLPNVPDKETLLQQTYLEAFHRNYESVQRWTRWKEDHERVKSTLSTLPDKLSHEVVIPFGSKALVKAKLVHTNEILTCIGSSWFVKQTAKQSIAMCDRRIQQSDEMLKKLDDEKILLSNRQRLPKLEEAFPSDDTKEIFEAYNEEAEAEWRRQHREREIEYRRKLAELRKKQVDQPPLQTEEDIFRRLEELELEEELNDELERLHAEYEADYENNDEEEEEITDDEDDSSEDEDRSHINGSNTKDMNDTESSSLEHQKSLSSPSSMPFCREAWGENSSVELETMKKSRRISFADEAQALSRSSPDGGLGSENICIRFRHSEDALIHTPTRVTSAKGPDEPPMYVTPADIYDIHRLQALNSQPKSILKKSSYVPEIIQDKDSSTSLPTSASFGSSLGLNFSDSEEDDDILSERPSRDLSHLPPVLCDVQESTASTSQPAAQGSSQRPMSRFRLAKQKGKK